MRKRGSARTTGCRRGRAAAARRSGLILYAVLVILAMVSLVAVSLMFRVQADLQAATAGQAAGQAYLAALSGIQRAVLVLRTGPDDPEALRDNEAMFRDQLVCDDGAEQWYFTVYAYNDQDPGIVRYGITDEATRINVNNRPRENRATLAALPGMTDELIDALIDYVDPDDMPEAQGAEAQSYARLDHPYLIANADLTTLGELLLVRGFDAPVVYGEDANRNGLLDPNENDGDITFPPDNTDGVLDRGLAGFVTTVTREPDVDGEGNPRINLNGDPESLQNAGLPDQALTFIARYRMEGHQFNDPSELLGEEAGIGPGQIADILDRFTAFPTGDLTAILGPPAGGRGMSVERFDPFELDGLAPESPAPSSRPAQANPPRAGRVNVNTAPVEVLAMVGDMGEQAARRIVEHRTLLEADQARTPAWLLTEELVDEELFKRIAPILTTRSYQYRVQAVGYGLPSGRFCVLEAVIDLESGRPRVMHLRQLTRLGAPFALTGPPQR
ncbi:MAG: hypothetical protein GX591_12515 [Planctomycetes bacterium]|nr:hypothetical protein [Planctomycetota bacterium]